MYYKEVSELKTGGFFDAMTSSDTVTNETD